MNLGKRAKWFLGTLTFVATLIVLLYSGLSFWGRREWANTQATLKAKGETMNILSIAQPELPDADNFFASPLWKDLRTSGDDRDENLRIFGLKKALGGAMSRASQGVVNYKDPISLENVANYFLENNLPSIPGELPANTVLRRLSNVDDIMAEISDATSRRGSRMKLDYEAGPAFFMPQLPYMMMAGQFLSVQGAAFAVKGDGGKAKEDILLQIRLSKMLAAEPLSISQLVRLAILQLASQSIWMGLESHCWNDAQIEQIESQLNLITLREGLVIGLRGDRALLCTAMKQFARRGGMKALSEKLFLNDEKKDSLSNWLQLTFFPTGLTLVDLSNICLTLQHAIDAVNSSASFLDIYNILHQGNRKGPQLNNSVSSVILPALADVTYRFQEVQIRLDQARIACALERYLLRFGMYPDSLGKLPDLPMDSSSGKSFHYEVTPGGGYKLWSVGFDGKDDGGQSFDKKTRTGDWTWIMPGGR